VLGWDWCGFHKKCAGTRYAELVFLHPMGTVGHVVHSSLSRVRNVDALFFMPVWARYDFHKNRTGTRYTELMFLLPVGYAGNVAHFDSSGARNIDPPFSFSGGPDAISIKSMSGHITLNLCLRIRRGLQVM
jgi:hypothetical protein